MPEHLTAPLERPYNDDETILLQDALTQIKLLENLVDKANDRFQEIRNLQQGVAPMQSGD